ncbi:HepT-like ribonuclease domain-containing protein [Haloimpatiens lingqiaonensis]|uniref:HepT-like ribonuclease domain-containing protein n=1 Tax=Haloimpatiens lingqiaonensis TaxID=1380675 RepID=UPI0010FF4E6F|nr:HepT-like ribonuclease domain-containing protein [Haloimpatiens lingqiaonensis]
MNEDRLYKIIEDMTETISLLEGCMNSLKNEKDANKSLYIEYGLKQIFVDFFITVESLTSLILKELKKFKIGIDMKQSLEFIKENNIIDEELHLFLDEARLMRNRISHRYKEPSRKEILEFINLNMDKFSRTLEVTKKLINM